MIKDEGTKKEDGNDSLAGSEAEDLFAGSTKQNSSADMTFSLRELQRFHDIFCRAEYEHDGMDMDAFVHHIGPALLQLHPNTSQLEVEVLFKRIDANANGSVDWGEFSEFLLMNDVKATLLLTAEGKSRDFAPLPTWKGNQQAQHPAMKLLLHKHSMHRMVLHPRVNKYYSASVDGMVKQWNADTLRHERTLQLANTAVMDMTVAPQFFDAVCVLGIDKTVGFYSADSGELMRVYSGDPRHHYSGHTRHATKGDIGYEDDDPVVSRQAFSLAVNREDSDTVKYTSQAPLFGQVDTCVPVLKHFRKPLVHDAIKMNGFGHFAKNHIANFPSAISTMKVLGESTQMIMMIGFDNGFLQTYPVAPPIVQESYEIFPTADYRIHWNAINKIIPCPELELLLTCSNDGMIQARNLERLNDVHTILGEGALDSLQELSVRDMDTSIRGHTHRITTMDWNYELRMILSCAPEQDALLWSPYIPKPMGKLDCHRGNVIDVHFLAGTRQALTLSDDKTIRIFDLRTMRVLQTLEDNQPTLANQTDRLNCVKFDEKRDYIVLGSTAFRTWGQQQNCAYQMHYSGHRRPVIGLVVSRQFGQLITCDAKMIVVWELRDSFEPSMRWEVDAGIADICLDANGRRLIVGTVDGSTLIFNYVNGQLLKKCLPGPGRDEVTSVSCGCVMKPRVASLIIATHEEGSTSIFLDEDGNDGPLREVSSGEHAACAAIVTPSFLVIGDRGAVRVLNMSETSCVATPLARLPRSVTSLGCKVAIYCGPLIDEPVPQTRQYLMDRDTYLFGDGGVQGKRSDATAAGQEPKSDEDLGLESRQMAALGVTEHIVVMHRTDPEIVITASSDGIVQFWDIKNMTETLRFRATVATEGITAMALDQFENRLAIGDHAGYVSIFDISGLLNSNHSRKERRGTFRRKSQSQSMFGESSAFGGMTPENNALFSYDDITLVMRFRAHMEFVSRIAFNEVVQLTEGPPREALPGNHEDDSDEDMHMKVVNSIRRRNTTIGIKKKAPMSLFTASCDTLTFMWDCSDESPDAAPRFVRCLGDGNYFYRPATHAAATLRVLDTVRIDLLRTFFFDHDKAMCADVAAFFVDIFEDNTVGVAQPMRSCVTFSSYRSSSVFSDASTAQNVEKQAECNITTATSASYIAAVKRAFAKSTYDDHTLPICIARLLVIMADPAHAHFPRTLSHNAETGEYYLLIPKTLVQQKSIVDPLKLNVGLNESTLSVMENSTRSRSQGNLEVDSHESSAAKTHHPVIEVLRAARHSACMSPGRRVDADGAPDTRPTSPRTKLTGPENFFTGVVSARPRQYDGVKYNGVPGEVTLFLDPKFEQEEHKRELVAVEGEVVVEENVCDVLFRLSVPHSEPPRKQYRHQAHPLESSMKPFSIFEFSEVPQKPSFDETMSSNGGTSSRPSTSPRSVNTDFLDLMVAEAIRQRDDVIASLPEGERRMVATPRSSRRSGGTPASLVMVRSEEERESARAQSSQARTPKAPSRAKVATPSTMNAVDESGVQAFLSSFKLRASVAKPPPSEAKQASLLDEPVQAHPPKYQRQGGLLGELAWVARLHSRLEVSKPPEQKKPPALCDDSKAMQQVAQDADHASWIKTLSSNRAKRMQDRKKEKQQQVGQPLPVSPKKDEGAE